MAISIAQYVDLLFKKLQGVAKTANSTVKGASNESIASPAFLRGDIVWVESNQIGNTAQAIAGISTAYRNGSAVECVADTTVPPIGGIRPTWLTNETYWIPQEFGATWLPKVFVGPSAAANIEATGTQIFSAGIGGVGEYYFDTQAGVLNFIGETIPTVLTAGNVVYVAGYQYSGLLGTTTLPGNTTIGNLVIANTTITTNQVTGNINLEPTGNGVAIIDTTTGLVLPTGNTTQRPASPDQGTIRFNTGSTDVEVWDGTQWTGIGGASAAITNQYITGDGSNTVFTLDQDTSAAAIIVSTNGVVQFPDVAYTVTGNLITFAEAPTATDVIDVRFTAMLNTVNAITNATGQELTITVPGVVNITNTHSLQLPTYTVSQATSLGNTATGQVIYVSNGDSGNPCLAVYSGSTWKRVVLGATIST
jgi:hypothetical protein